MEDTLNVELKYTNLHPPLCWQEVFGNTAPVELEIGFGKCGFLLDIAAQHPVVNFIGIESARKYYRKGGRKVQRAGLQNVKLLWGEAYHILKRYVPDQSLRTVYINFPDPWPKRRHAKRRLLKTEFITLLVRKLQSVGGVEIATDVETYNEQIQEIFQDNDLYEQLYYHSTNALDRSKREYFSDYEVMFLKQEKTIHYLKYRKK